MSAVTVGEVLTLPALRESRVVAGEGGLGRFVSGVNVMEVPDIESFVKPGEVLLTTTYPLREHPEDLGTLVRTLARLGLSALAVKTGRYLDALPTEMLEAADELDFPLIVLAEHTSFNDVIGALLAIVLTDYGADPAGAEAIRERLTGVALSGGGLDEIARTLGGALDRPVEIVDLAGVSLGRGGVDPAGDGEALWEFPINVAGSERGRILVHGEAEPTLGQRRLIRQACFAGGMHIAQALASLALDRRMRVLFLEELVTGRPSDSALVLQRSRLFGWDLSARRCVILAACSTELADPAVSAQADDVLPPGSLAWTRGNEVVALVPVPTRPEQPGLRGIAGEWRDVLARLGAGEVLVAVGGPVADVADVGESHAEARESLVIARATGQTVVLHELLTIERVILALPREHRAALVEQELGPIVAFDDLCRTLELFLGTGNAADAARRLFVHYNTMKHRMARITELLDVDLADPRTRLTLAFALQTRKFLDYSSHSVT